MASDKQAPAKMHHFIADLLMDMPLRGKVTSIEVLDGAYRVTVALHDGSVTAHQFSAYEMSRSMRGDAGAIAGVRTQLMNELAAAV